MAKKLLIPQQKILGEKKEGEKWQSFKTDKRTSHQERNGKLRRARKYYHVFQMLNFGHLTFCHIYSRIGISHVASDMEMLLVMKMF